jgi:membrane protein
VAKKNKNRGDLFSQVIRRSREERVAQSAGALSFTTAVSMVPLLAVSFALFARIPALRGIGETLREHLLRGLLPADITRTVLKYLGQFTGNASGLTLVGFAALAASALALLLSVENTLNRIWQAKTPRPVLGRLALYLAMLLAAPVVIGASLWATASVLASSGAWMGTKLAWALHPVNLGSVVLTAAGFSCLFRFVPHVPVRWRHAIAGGLLAGIAFELGKRGFAIYLANVPTYRTVYGAFAPLLAFLAWLYYSWFITLAAALVSAGLPRAPAMQIARRRLPK